MPLRTLPQERNFPWQITSISGRKYPYHVLSTPRVALAIKAEAGNYMFVKWLPTGPILLYVGQAEDLRLRIPNHERLDEAIRLGATHVLAHTNSAGEGARLAEERDIILRWNPPLNTHHRRVS